jgi:urea transport system ATP-binding protein
VSDILTLREVTVGYGDGTVLSDVSLSVESGQALCLLGRNGVGKTTLIKTVIGLLRPRQGHVVFEGQGITRLAPNARARLGIGYVPQGRLVFPQLTVHDNLLVAQEGLRAGQTTGLDGVPSCFRCWPRCAIDPPARCLAASSSSWRSVAR